MKKIEIKGINPIKDGVYKVYEIEGIYVLIKDEKQEDAGSTKSPKDRICWLLKTLDFRERVEGRFEKHLSEEELKIFREMLSSGEVEIYKSSEKYVKGIYRLKKRKDVFVFDKEEDAKKFSKEHKKELLNGEFLSIKGFDGKYYAVRKELFDKISRGVLAILNEEKTFDDLKNLLSVDDNELKAVLEILKEKGEIIERKKNMFMKV